jgi:hypothetical protein
LIYSQVTAYLQKPGQDPCLAPKITGIKNVYFKKINNSIIYQGMLIDFSVFDIPDILEMLKNNKELEVRIKEALVLLKE